MKKKTHYLLTFDLIPGVLRMHAYLATIDRAAVEVAIEKMMDAAEKMAEEHKFKIFAPIFLSTTLDTGVDTVQEIVSKHFPQATKKFRTAKEVHFTCWAWSPASNEEDDARLMELH